MLRVMGVAGPLHRCVEIGRVVIIGNWRVEIGPAAEPALRRCKKTRVHMHGRDMRIGHMRHQADAGREKARVVSRSVDRSDEHTSDLQSLMPTSYALFVLTKKN